jgi:hypothetical protein
MQQEEKVSLHTRDTTPLPIGYQPISEQKTCSPGEWYDKTKILKEKK